jgi:hypothetical protein
MQRMHVERGFYPDVQRDGVAIAVDIEHNV